MNNNNNAMMVNNNNNSNSNHKKGELSRDSLANTSKIKVSTSIPTAPTVSSMGNHLDNSAAILRKDLRLSDSSADSDY